MHARLLIYLNVTSSQGSPGEDPRDRNTGTPFLSERWGEVFTIPGEAEVDSQDLLFVV